MDNAILIENGNHHLVVDNASAGEDSGKSTGSSSSASAVCTLTTLTLTSGSSESTSTTSSSDADSSGSCDANNNSSSLKALVKSKVKKVTSGGNKSKLNAGHVNANSGKTKTSGMETIQSHLGLLLDGKPYEEMYELCDFSLADQNEAAVSKGVQPSAASDYKPVIQKSVTYIVAAVLINDSGEVLMMQVRVIHVMIHPNSRRCSFSRLEKKTSEKISGLMRN